MCLVVCGVGRRGGGEGRVGRGKCGLQSVCHSVPQRGGVGGEGQGVVGGGEGEGRFDNMVSGSVCVWWCVGWEEEEGGGGREREVWAT